MIFEGKTIMMGQNDGMPVPGGKCIKDCSEGEFRGHAKKLLGDKYDATLGLESLKQVYADAVNAIGRAAFDQAIEAKLYEMENS